MSSSFNVRDTAREIPELVVADSKIDSLNTNTANVEALDARTSIYNGMRTVTVVGYAPTSLVGTPPGTAIPLNSRPGRPLATDPTSPDLLQIPGINAVGGPPGIIGLPLPYQPMSIMITSNGTELDGVGAVLTVGLCSAIDVPPSAPGQVILINNATPVLSAPAFAVEAGIVAEGGYPPVPAAPFGPTDLGSAGSLVGNPFLPGDPISWIQGGGGRFLVLETGVSTLTQGDIAVYFTFRVPAYPPLI